MYNVFWKDKIKEFQTIDLRHLQGDFFDGLKKKAEDLAVGQGLHIVQSFEPYPLYAVMKGLGYERFTERTAKRSSTYIFTAREINAEKTTQSSSRLHYSTIL